MKNLKLLIALLLFVFITTNAQSDETKEKLKNLEGDVTKITIATEDGEIEITGEDATILLKRMKAKKHITIKELKHCDSDKNGNVIFFKKGEHDEDITIDLDIDIDDVDGEKVVVIKKTIDGKEVIEEYKGEDAEKFLVKHSGGKHGNKFISEDGEIHVVVGMDDDDLHWISEGDHKEIKKKVNVEVDDGIKTVTITTTEDGKESVKVYTGEEANEYLEIMEHGKKMKIHISEDGDKKVMKTKVIIIEKDDDDDDEHEDSDND